MAYNRSNQQSKMACAPVSAAGYVAAPRPSTDSTRRPERMNTVDLESTSFPAPNPYRSAGSRGGYHDPFVDDRETEHLASLSPYPPHSHSQMPPRQYHYQRSRTNSETSRAPSPSLMAGSLLEKDIGLDVPTELPKRKTFWSRFKSESGPDQHDDEELTDEEREMLSQGMVDWKAMRSWRFWFRRQWICEPRPSERHTSR